MPLVFNGIDIFLYCACALQLSYTFAKACQNWHRDCWYSKELSKSLLGIVNILKLVRDWKKIVKMVDKDSPYTQGFLIAITLQIDVIIGWSNLGFMSFWPMISRNTLLIVIKSWTYFSDITFEVPKGIIGGRAVVKFENKVFSWFFRFQPFFFQS